MANVQENHFILIYYGPEEFSVCKPGETYDDQDPDIEILAPGQSKYHCYAVGPSTELEVEFETRVVFNWDGALIDLSSPHYYDRDLHTCLESLARCYERTSKYRR